MHIILWLLLAATPVVFAESSQKIAIEKDILAWIEDQASFCENLYWQPNALQNMQEHGCDIVRVEAEIQKVQKGIY